MAPLQELLLAEAREAEAELTHAEAAAELAKVRFRQSLGRLHEGGASTREIARAFKISHQRVHQLIDARSWPCTFCAESQGASARFVAGPGVRICHACIIRAGAAEAPFAMVPRHDRRRGHAAACSFCGKARAEVDAMAEHAGQRICAECLALCREIIAEG